MVLVSIYLTSLLVMWYRIMLSSHRGEIMYDQSSWYLFWSALPLINTFMLLAVVMRWCVVKFHKKGR